MPYGAEGWPRFSSYKPLDHLRNEIRLLRFHTQRESGLLNFSLEHKSLNGASSGSIPHQGYFALSYAWGTAVEARPILVDGEVLMIRASLWRALHSLWRRWRSSSEVEALRKSPLLNPFVDTFRLWVDCICINQDDMSERNHQIQSMHEIFGAAHGVFGWLVRFAS